VILGSEAELQGLLEDRHQRFANLPLSKGAPMSLKKITKQASRDLEREIILQVLAENRWNRRQTARTLDISYRALLYKLKEACTVVPRVSRGRDDNTLAGEAKAGQQS
jgi:two-component system response regulator AtoC